jgi:hypothetical protein
MARRFSVGAQVIRFSDAAFGRISEITNAHIVIDLPGLGSAMVTRSQFRADYQMVTGGQEAMNTCEGCGGKFPTRTSGIWSNVMLCMSASQCQANQKQNRLKGGR